ncbi:MAG: hypothetical protein GF320_19580 [Armatimonadia bacterium]|nr:hypothetical protein [Armatimonadia bacterium]
MRDFLRNWGSCLGLIVAIGLTTLMGFIAYQIDRTQRAGSMPPEDDRALMRLEGTLVQVWSEDDPPQLVAEIEAATVEVSRDQEITDIHDVEEIRVYRDDALYMVGTARRARYDEALQELRVFDSVHMEQVDGDMEMDTEAFLYTIDDRLIAATEPVTATMRDAVLKTPSGRFNVATERFMAPHQVVVNTREGGQIVSDSARGDLAEDLLSLIGNVVMDATVEELQRLREDEPAPDDADPPGDEGQRIRVRAQRADVDLETEDVRASGSVTIVGEEGSAMGETAEFTDEQVVLAGGATITLRDQAGGGPVTVETAMVEYDTEEDLAVCPSQVRVSTREGTFQGARAQAKLREGTWRLQGGVTGRLMPPT